MASIDALSGVATKPSVSLNENDFTTLKSVKEVITLDFQWLDLLKVIHSFVAEHIEECKTIPRTLKSDIYKDLVDSFLEDNGQKYWSEERDGFMKATHFAWPVDQEK